DPPTKHQDEFAAGVELIDSIGAAGAWRVLGDVHVTGVIDGDAVWRDELTGSFARVRGTTRSRAHLRLHRTIDDPPAVGLEERSAGGELVDPVVPRVRDVDAARVWIDGDAFRSHELPGAAAADARLAEAHGRACLEMALAVGDAPAVLLDEGATRG